jgi:membrane protein DedA with SNARE-associated domain
LPGGSTVLIHLLPDWLNLAGHHPSVQGLLIVIGTFVLEDAATILAAMDVQAGKVTWVVALVALYLGIVLGDIGLYGLGRAARATPWAKRWAPPERFARSGDWLRGHVFTVVFISRFLPGARLPTYTACGYFGASLTRFIIATSAATLIWTTMLFGLSLRIGQLMTEYLGAWRWVGMVGFALTIALAGHLIARRQTQPSTAPTP